MRPLRRLRRRRLRRPHASGPRRRPRPPLARAVLAALRQRDGQSTGQLFRELAGGDGNDRRAFERLLGGLAGVGLLTVSDDDFEKEGRTIHFQRATLTADGLRDGAAAAALAALQLTEEPAAAPRKRARGAKREAVGASRRTGARRRGAAETGAGRAGAAEGAADGALADPGLVAALKAWRLGEARRSRVPAFRILTDRTLLALAAERPAGEAELLAVSGIGPTLARKYGTELLEIVARSG